MNLFTILALVLNALLIAVLVSSGLKGEVHPPFVIGVEHIIMHSIITLTFFLLGYLSRKPGTR